MKRLQNLLIILLVPLYIQAQEVTRYDVVIEPNDFLVKPDEKSAMLSISGWGYLSTLGTWALGGLKPSELLPTFFYELDKLFPDQIPPVKFFWRGHEAPYPIYASSISTNKEEICNLTTAIHDKFTEKGSATIFHDLTDITFNPQKTASIMKVIPAATTLLKDLKDTGHTVHIFGNGNTEFFEQLKKQKPNIFAHVNGSIVGSGHIQRLKSEEGAYDMFLKGYLGKEYNPANIIAIETNPDLVKTLKDQGFNTIYFNGDYESVRNALVGYRALNK